jgi:hypothetical protein
MDEFSKYIAINPNYFGDNAVKKYALAFINNYQNLTALINSGKYDTEFKWLRRWRLLKPVTINCKGSKLSYSDGLPWMDELVDIQFNGEVDDVIRIAGYESGVVFYDETKSQYMHYLDLQSLGDEDEIKTILLDQYGFKYQELHDDFKKSVCDFDESCIEKLCSNRSFITRLKYVAVRSSYLGILLKPDKITLTGVDRKNKRTMVLVSEMQAYFRDRGYPTKIKLELEPDFYHEDFNSSKSTWIDTDEGRYYLIVVR